MRAGSALFLVVAITPLYFIMFKSARFYSIPDLPWQSYETIICTIVSVMMSVSVVLFMQDLKK